MGKNDLQVLIIQYGIQGKKITQLDPHYLADFKKEVRYLKINMMLHLSVQMMRKNMI